MAKAISLNFKLLFPLLSLTFAEVTVFRSFENYMMFPNIISSYFHSENFYRGTW